MSPRLSIARPRRAFGRSFGFRCASLPQPVANLCSEGCAAELPSVIYRRGAHASFGDGCARLADAFVTGWLMMVVGFAFDAGGVDETTREII